MADNKTKPTDADIKAFIESVENERRRNDAKILVKLMKRATSMKPRLWGENLIGYGHYNYKYKSGHGGEYFLTGFSPRKAATSIYIMPGFKPYADQLAKLGKHKHSVSCLYVTRLENIDLDILEEIVKDSVARMKATYPDWSK